MSSPEPDPAALDSRAQRRHRRFAMSGSVRLYSGNAMWTTELCDLSLAGVRVRCPKDWNGREGGRFRLDLRLEGGVMISMGVELARNVSGVGLGFSCAKIDLGSFIQLKRLVELNLGNPTLLLAELATLIPETATS